MKQMAIAVLVGGMVMASATVASADVKDAWISTQATIALLTMDGFSVKGATADTTDGRVTIHGRVGTDTDRTKAEQAVLKVNGVKAVENLLEIAPANRQDMVLAVADADVKDGVEASLKTDTMMKDVTVTSVDDGVVRLAGKADNPGENLRAIQNAYTVTGVSRVASDIQTPNDE
jgi:osmotically-inducible protein OsmY